jgi:PIN domain nuclease of toxin-antitoxin system
MKYLLDTHFLLWIANLPKSIPVKATKIINDSDNELFFSAASLWEIVIKNGLGREDFQVDINVLRRALVDHEYVELPVTGAHVAGVAGLPSLHKDPFDRILIAQAISEGMILLTTDKIVAQYPGSIQFFRF